MTTKKTLSTILTLIAIVVLVWFWNMRGGDVMPIVPTPVEMPAQQATYTNASADMITVEAPLPGAVASKNVSVMGQARGSWFFEASFPVQLIDKDGNTLATAPAQAQGDWMTDNFVPFKTTLQVSSSYTGPATLILKKDNPSGLPEHDASVSIPITIQ